MNDDAHLNSESARIAHLGFIQAAISRMANNAFALKALVVTVTGAGLGLYVSDSAPETWTAAFGVIPVIVLWLLDAGYLRLEKRFRALYSAVVNGTENRAMWMDPTPYKDNDGGFWAALTNWSVVLLYLLAVFVFVGVSLSGCIMEWING